MGNRTAKFISAIFASVLAGAPFAAVSQDAPKAADDCLASPKATAPQGQHWYYRVERSTKRQCWYLRDEAPKAAQGTQQDPQQSAQSATAAPAATPSRTVRDARAEWTSSPTAPAHGTTASIPAQSAAAARSPSNAAPDGSAQPPAVASRWPDATADSASPAPQAAPATTVADAGPTPQADVSPAPVTLAAAEAPIGKPTGSLQMLLLVVVGALALAGITGSLIYRFAGVRARVRANEGTRRRVNWDNSADWERELEEARAPWLDVPKPVASPLPRPRPVDFGFARYRESKPAPAASHLAAEEAQVDDREVTTAQADTTAADTTALAFDFGEAQTHDASHGEASSVHAEDGEADADAVDIDAITAILERLAEEGPRLSQPGPAQLSLAIGSAASAQSRRDRSDVRA
jgi:hypothetical protein